MPVVHAVVQRQILCSNPDFICHQADWVVRSSDRFHSHPTLGMEILISTAQVGINIEHLQIGVVLGVVVVTVGVVMKCHNWSAVT